MGWLGRLTLGLSQGCNQVLDIVTVFLMVDWGRVGGVDPFVLYSGGMCLVETWPKYRELCAC